MCIPLFTFNFSLFFSASGICVYAFCVILPWNLQDQTAYNNLIYKYLYESSPLIMTNECHMCCVQNVCVFICV